MEFFQRLAELLLQAFDLDDRPGAQRFTWGCMLTLIVLLVGILVWREWPLSVTGGQGLGTSNTECPAPVPTRGPLSRLPGPWTG
jgi:hypothetical protein